MDAVVVDGLWKTFRLPHEKRNTLFEQITGTLYGKKGYEEFVALKNINFTVKKGEAVGIIGENGSGKSTLLKIIANILRSTRGSVKIYGKITPFLELGVGFQPDLTAKENIYIYGAVMGLSDKEIDARLDEILEFSGLKQFQDAKLKNLSSGMQVRLAFATAIQTNPEILLMDEVLAVGDMDFQQKCLDVFQRYLKEKKTIVFVSHDLNSVRRFCSKALLLRHGEQVAFGETNEIIDKYVYGVDDKAKHADNLQSESKKEEGKIEEKKTRWGNKKVKITNVRFIDKFGRENERFMSKDPLLIKIEFESQEEIINPVFGVIVHDEKENWCIGTNTDVVNLKTGKIKNFKAVELNIEKLPLNQGIYFVSVAVVSEDLKETFDYLDKMYKFNIINTSKEYGRFLADYNWKLIGENRYGPKKF